MASALQTRNLEKIIKLAYEVLAQVKQGAASSPARVKRKRRSGKELVAFRRMLKAERRKGVPVTELAQKHGVSTAYIYTLD